MYTVQLPWLGSVRMLVFVRLQDAVWSDVVCGNVVWCDAGRNSVLNRTWSYEN